MKFTKTPSTKIHNSQIRRNISITYWYILEIGFSDLDIIWNLCIGIWDFSTVSGKKSLLSESAGADFDFALWESSYHVDHKRVRWYIKFDLWPAGFFSSLHADCLTKCFISISILSVQGFSIGRMIPTEH